MFLLIIPPFQNVDEDGHYAYVQSLSHWDYPDLALGDSDVSRDLQKAYHMDEVKGTAILDYPSVSIDPKTSDYIDKSIQGYHPPAYYFLGSLIYTASRSMNISPLASFYATKVTSLLMLLIFLASFWKVIKIKWGDLVANYLTLAVAIQPTLMMTGVSINPEIGTVAFFTMTLGLLFSGLKKQAIGNAQILYLVLSSGVAILCKFNAVILIPIVILSLMLTVDLPRKWRTVSIYTAGVLTILISWLVFNQFHYGELLPHNADLFSVSDNAFVVDRVNLLFSFLGDFKLALLSLPGNFGYGEGLLFHELRILYMGFVLVFLGLGIWYYYRQEESAMKVDHLGSISTLAMLFIFIFNLAYAWKLKNENFTRWVYVLQGRYFLLALLPATVLLFSGIIQTVKVQRPESIAKGLFLISLAYYLANLLFTLIPRYYV